MFRGESGPGDGPRQTIGSRGTNPADMRGAQQAVIQRRFCAGKREHRIAVKRRVRRTNRTRQAVVRHHRDAFAFHGAEIGISGHHGERGVGAGIHAADGPET